MFRVLLSVGSLGVAICAVALVEALVWAAFADRPLTQGETIIALLGACCGGLAWWLLMRRKLNDLGPGWNKAKAPVKPHP